MIEIRGDDGSRATLNDSAGEAIFKAFDKAMHHPNVVILVTGREWKCINQDDMKEVLQGLIEE